MIRTIPVKYVYTKLHIPEQIQNVFLNYLKLVTQNYIFLNIVFPKYSKSWSIRNPRDLDNYFVVTKVGSYPSFDI